MDIYDVIIVGAGPAGLMAAREFTKSNLKYLIVDSKSRIGYPLRCGEVTREDTFLELFEHTDYPFITNKISRFLNEVRGEMKKVSWSTKKELINSTWIVILSVAALTLFIGTIDFIISQIMDLVLR